MGTPKKRYSYTAVYTDGSYITYELTREDLLNIEEQLFAGQNFASISLGILGLKDIRALVEQKAEEPESEQTETETGTPVLDQESYDWLKMYMGGDK